ncbi:hypothetical protein [Burkholderia territorii]|uniref:hypothetical protein n=1 Tax=Burkholderia territorii TaxID=1503055 RepID=UPI00075C6DAC|nr:hypothetical protein [Burkholderia territorii]
MRKWFTRALDSRAYVGSAILVLAGIVIAASGMTSAWWASALQSVGAGLITSLFLFAVYDRVLERRLEREVDARRAIAMRRLASTLRNHVEGTLFDICYGGVEKLPHRPVTHLELVRNFLAPAAEKVSITAPVSSHYPSQVAIGTWTAMAFTSFRTNLNNWLAIHGAVVPIETVSAVEALLDSRFSRAAVRFDWLVEEVEKLTDLRSAVRMGDATAIREYAAALGALVDAVEQGIGEPLGVLEISAWKREYFAPGHARAPA